MTMKEKQRQGYTLLKKFKPNIPEIDCICAPCAQQEYLKSKFRSTLATQHLAKLVILNATLRAVNAPAKEPRRYMFYLIIQVLSQRIRANQMRQSFGESNLYLTSDVPYLIFEYARGPNSIYRRGHIMLQLITRLH